MILISLDEKVRGQLRPFSYPGYRCSAAEAAAPAVSQWLKSGFDASGVLS